MLLNEVVVPPGSVQDWRVTTILPILKRINRLFAALRGDLAASK